MSENLRQLRKIVSLTILLIVFVPGFSRVYAADTWLKIDGRIQLGMPADELALLLDGYVSDKENYGINTLCYYLMAPDDKPGIYYMIVEDKLVRLDIDHSELGIQTPAGIGIDSNDEAVRAAYPDIFVSPHPYLGDIGSYMATSREEGVGLIFETTAGIVTSFRYGQSPALDYIEGCL